MNKIKKKDNWLVTFRKNWQLLMLCIPALIIYILFNYIPMIGAVMAFKDYRYNLGIFGSEWCGLANFEYLFRSTVLWRVVRNTVLYSLAFLVVGMILEMTVALLLYEINNRKCLKFYQTCMQFPRFMSWIIVGYITYAILNPASGVLNQVLSQMGMDNIDVYREPSAWPMILTVVNAWKALGVGCIMYYAALMGIDSSLYEAAAIDGANRWQQTLHISLPGLVSLATIKGILAIGDIFNGNLDLFYQIPRNVGILYPTTDVIPTYVFRALQGANYSAGSAVGLAQGVVGLIMITIANGVVRKIAPENAMF